MHLYESNLLELMSKVKNSQMKKFEYEYIARMLGDKNFLVFGTGYDTKFWRFCNSNGFTIFLEHDPKWISNQDNDVFLVNYTTKLYQYKELLKEYKKNFIKNLEIKIPDFLYNVTWDIIFVDGPPGNKNDSIGRMQSIYTAYKLSNNNTNILIHDCDRIVEDVYSKEFFTVVKQLDKLRHCKK